MVDFGKFSIGQERKVSSAENDAISLRLNDIDERFNRLRNAVWRESQAGINIIYSEDGISRPGEPVSANSAAQVASKVIPMAAHSQTRELDELEKLSAQAKAMAETTAQRIDLEVFDDAD